MNAVNSFAETVAENGYSTTITVTKTLLSTATTTATTTSLINAPTSTAIDNTSNLSNLKEYLNSCINSTLELNSRLVNVDITKRLTPLAKSNIQNWQTSFYNTKVLLNNTRTQFLKLNDSVLTDLDEQSDRLNAAVTTLTDLGLIVASSADEDNALQNIYLDFSNVTEEFSWFEGLLNSSSADTISLSSPNVSFETFDLHTTAYSDSVALLISNISSSLGHATAAEKKLSLKKRQVSEESSKFVKLTIIFLCIYPMQVIGWVILEWFSHAIRRDMILGTLDCQLLEMEDKKTTLQRYDDWKPRLSKLCESVQNPFTVQSATALLKIGDHMWLRRKQNSDYPTDVQCNRTTAKKVGKLTWWFYNSCAYQLYFLLLILMTWVVISSTIPASYSTSLSKRAVELSSSATYIPTNSIGKLCESFDTEINTNIEELVRNFYNTSINQSLEKYNDKMTALVTKLPSSISEYVQWDNFTGTEFNTIVPFNSSAVVSTYLGLSDPYDASSTDADASLFQREQTAEFDLKFALNKLFLNSIIIWACIHLFQLVICIIF